MNCAVKALLLAATFLSIANSTTYYVSPSGSDAGPGTLTQPFRTLQKAADIVNPGDSVIALDGNFIRDPNQSNLSTNAVATLKRSGTASNPIVFRAKNKWKAIVDGESNKTSVGFWLTGASYNRIENFEIKDLSEHGFKSYGSSYLHLTGNHIHHIGRICSDVTIGLDGIGTMQESYHHVYDGNVFHDIGRLAEGEGGCHNATTIYQGNDHGIYLMNGKSLIANNVFYNIKAGWAIHIYNTSTLKDSINIINNTFAGANQFRSGYILTGKLTSDVAVQNNLFCEPNSGAVNSYGDCATMLRIKVGNNLAAGGSILVPGACLVLDLGGNISIANAGLMNPAGMDFRLTPASPAIDKGVATNLTTHDFLGNPRPQGPGYDIGAYEYVSNPGIRHQQPWQMSPTHTAVKFYPAVDGVWFELEGITPLDIEIRSISGKSIARFFHAGPGRVAWKTQRLPVGLLLVQASSNGQTQTSKLFCGY